MKSPRVTSTLLVPALALALLVGARADEASSTIKFSDPAKPGTVRINLGRGELHVQGADTTEVSVKSDAKAAPSKRKDGMRVISAASSFSLKESDNVVVIDAASDWGKGNSNFQLTVPRNTSIIVQNAWGGDISCAGISGDIEANSMHGEIRLDDISGGVVVGTMNGEIRATIRELHEGKPVSFTSMNGEVVLRVPENLKASVRLRTQNGSVLTDFDESALVTKTESAAGLPRVKALTLKGSRVLSAEIQDAIREATQYSATAVREALEAVKEGYEASRLDADEARQQMEEARKEIERARRDTERAHRDAERQRAASARGNRNDDTPPPAPPAAPAAPAHAPKIAGVPPRIPSIPTLTGGKVVTGTLNGGGPEISVATLNGDVTLRRLEPGK